MCSQLDTEGTRSRLTVVRSCAYFSVSVRGRVSDLVGMCSVACLSSVDLIPCLARGERGQEGAEGVSSRCGHGSLQRKGHDWW